MARLMLENAGSSEATPRREFFGSLEAMRGVAAFLVVLYHLPPWHDAVYWIPLIRHSNLMVDFFFVLSGFVLYHSYANRLNDRRDFWRFLALRFGRLYPVHLLFLLPFLGIELAKYVAAHGQTGADSRFGASPLSAIMTTLVANLLLAQGLGLNSNQPTMNFPNWSISTEFYAYLVFAIVLVTTRRKFIGGAVLLVIVSVVPLVGYGHALGEFSHFFRCIAGFFLGCVTRAVYEPLRGKPLSGEWPLLALGPALVLLCLEWGSSPWEFLSLPLSALGIVLLLLTPASGVNRLLATRPLKYLGEISYSLYMAHAIVQWLARQSLRVLLKRPEVTIDGIGTSRLSAVQALVAYPAVTILTLIVAHFAYKLVEAPCRELSRRRIASWLGDTRTRAVAQVP